MKTIHFKRLAKFRSSLVPFWVILGIRKSQFMELARPNDDPERTDSSEEVYDHAYDLDLNQYGFMIWSGKEKTITVSDDEISLFVMADYTVLSNEVIIPQGSEQVEIEISLEGGWNTPVNPIVRVLLSPAFVQVWRTASLKIVCFSTREMNSKC